jgi:aldehyde:ferredoxin oxidoreductase
MFGWQGKILRVNLSSGRIDTEPLDAGVARDYVGGRGLGIYFLNRLLDPRCDALSPENILIMTTGPLTGTTTPTGGRYMITTKSPLSGRAHVFDVRVRPLAPTVFNPNSIISRPDR